MSHSVLCSMQEIQPLRSLIGDVDLEHERHCMIETLGMAAGKQAQVIPKEGESISALQCPFPQ